MPVARTIGTRTSAMSTFGIASIAPVTAPLSASEMLPVALDTAPFTASDTLPLRVPFRLDARSPINGEMAPCSAVPIGIVIFCPRTVTE